MVSSIEENNGFYIGRYEAGKDSNGKVVIQQNVDVYTNIKWGNAMNDATGEGAVEKSKDFKIGKAYENSVTSTLIYGIQWDATMQFFDNNYINGISDIENSYVSNSTGKGNYDENENTNDWKGKIAKTGSSPEYSIKNIYDMAGNVWEWTMEAYNTDLRIVRGGDYVASGSSDPASIRSNNRPFNFHDYIGFRIALYLGL